MNDVRTLEALGNVPAARKRRLWTIGQRVYVKDGPFARFNGQIGSLDSRGRLTVLLEIFARLTPVTLDESQIEAA
jgi:transcriptional antiterminator NusG